MCCMALAGGGGGPLARLLAPWHQPWVCSTQEAEGQRGNVHACARDVHVPRAPGISSQNKGCRPSLGFTGCLLDEGCSSSESESDMATYSVTH